MDNIFARNIVIFKPKIADPWNNLGIKKFETENLNGYTLLNFEAKGNRIELLDSAKQKPCLSMDTEHLTTTLSLGDDMPVVTIQGRATMAQYHFLRPTSSYSTVPLRSLRKNGLKIRFELPIKSKPSVIRRYEIIDERSEEYLGVLLVSRRHIYHLIFEDAVSETQKQLIVGVTAFIISDFLRVENLFVKSVYGFSFIWSLFGLIAIGIIIWMAYK